MTIRYHKCKVIIDCVIITNQKHIGEFNAKRFSYHSHRWWC